MNNKRIIKIGTLLITIAAMMIAASTITTASNWPMFRNDAGNTAYSAETINLPLTEQWHSSAPAVEENGAVVSNGIVYMCSDAYKLYAFEVSTGAIMPGFPVTIGFTYGSPAVDETNNIVYTLCRDGILYTFYLNGTQAWTRDVGNVGYIYNEGPIIDNGFVYFKAGGNLQKYDAAGTLQWSSPAGGNSDTQPSIMGDSVYLNDESNYIRKYNKTTGTEITTGGFPIYTSYSMSALTTVDGKIFLKADKLKAYDANNGNFLWDQLCGGDGTYSDSPAVANGVVYVYGYSDSKIYAFDINTGATIAGFPSVALNPTGDRNWNSPAVADDKIFIGAGTSQKLKVLGAAGSANAGQVLEEHLTFSYDTQGFDLCSPVISDGVVFAMLDGGGLYAFFSSGVNWSGGAIIINNGENCTGSRDVTLTLDNGSIPNVVSMRISEDPFFVGAIWEPFATVKAWQLSDGLGMKTVYAQFMNANEQLSNVFNDQIEFSENCGGVVDNTPPVTTKTIGTPQYDGGVWVNLSTPITLTATDPGEDATGVKEIHYKINDVETIVQGDQVTFTFMEECTHTLEFWAVDNAGNIGNHTTQTHYVDDTGPDQTIQFGEPKDEYFVYHDGVGYKGIGALTPVWINSTDIGCDNGGVGSSYLSYNIYIGQQYGEWTLHGSKTVYDNQAGDMNPISGKISVILYMDESCWHEIHYWCCDLLGNRAPEVPGSFFNSDFLVDATGPTTQIVFGTPNMMLNDADYISCETPITFYANDTGCRVGGAGVATLVWSVDMKMYDDEWEVVQNGMVTDNDANDLDATVGKIKYIIYMTESCEHHIYAQATDYFGNVGPQLKKYIKVDCTPPITIKEIGQPQYYNAAEDITYVTTRTPIWLNTTDQPGNCSVGCDYLHWEIYIYNETSQGWDLLSWDDEYSNKVVLNFGEECYHKLIWWAIDKFGNKEETHVQYHKVDNTPPTTIKEYGTPQCYPEYLKLMDNGGDICITSHTPIYLNATDGGLCPVGSYIIYYRVWYNGQWSEWMQGAQTTDVVLTMDDLGAPYNQDCWHFINYYAVDDLMNTEETHNQSFYVDNTPPVIVKTVGDPNCTIDEDEYCILPTTPLTIDAYNDGCCAETGLTLRYKINDGNWVYPTFWPIEITIPEACTHILTIEAWDCLGNIATDVETFHVDIEAPLITKTVGNPNCSQGENTYCVTMQTPITVEATDQGCAVPCGPVTIQYNIGYDDQWTGWINYTGAIYFSEPCEHTLMLRAFDCLGNGMDDKYWDIETFYVDNTTPVIEKIVGKPQCSVENDTYCVTTDTEITINAYDRGCCNSMIVKYRINDNEWTDITAMLPYTFTFEEECEHTLYIWAYDCLGHTAYDNETFYVDETPPVIEKTVGDPNCTCDNETYCVTTDTLITIDAHDTGCCISEFITIEYRIWYNEQWTNWMPYTGPFTFEEACTHQLEIRATDCLGNTATDLETFYVDETAPELVKTVGDPHFYMGIDDYGHDVWYIYPLTEISFNAEELGCCPCFETTIYYRYWYLGVWSDWMVYDEPITFHKGCVHYLETYAVDCLGNAGEIDNETFWVCTSGEAGPTVTFINPSMGSTHCERTLDVCVKATDDITPSSELTVKIWIPGGRRNAPTFWYDTVYNATDGYFHAFIDIFEYQNGAELTIEGWAVDEDGYANFALPTTFMVCSNVGYDQWHQIGWNSLTIPWGEISCSFDVTDVLGSIDGNYAWVWYYDVVHDQWSSWYKYRDPGFNTLTWIEPGKQYWVYMETADHYFTDIYAPMVAITHPENGAIFNTTIAFITGTAFDNESGIDYVTIRLYSNDTGKYWNGTSWDTVATDLLCNGTETWSYDTTSVSMTAGLYTVTTTATDKVGCTAHDTHSFTIVSQACIASKTYTTDADFDLGTLTGLEHETVHNQLQMIPGEISTFPVMWIANAGEDSLSKWDTHQNIELARYHTWFGPLSHHDAWSGAAPSRTCVDAEGNCYVANRHFDSFPADVIKVYATNWIDRNHNGVLDTSYDANNDGTISASEMLPMTDTNGNNIIDPDEIVDERIAWVVSVGGNNGLGRSLAIDLEGNIWLGLYNTYQYYKLSSVDGSVLGGPYYVGSPPYGALVDRYGYLWGSTLGSTLLKLNTSNPTDYHNYYVPGTYGLALGYDSLGNTLVYPGYNSPYVIFNSSTETYSQPPNHPFTCLGIATDSKGNIVAGSSSNGAVAKFAPNGTILWNVAGQVVSEVRGIAVDSEDNVWAIHRDESKLCKYNGTNGAYMGVFNSGYQPYTYSDATGLGYATSVSVGTWDVIHDSKAADTEWDMISWTSLEPNGSSINVQVRSSNDQMNWSSLETATNGGMLSTTPPGRYLNVIVTFKKDIEAESPILYDLTIDGTCACAECAIPELELLKQVWVPAQTSQQNNQNESGEFITYTYTVADIVVFGYEDNTTVTIYGYDNFVVWTGTVDDGTYHLENVDEGVYKLAGNKKFSVLTGDPISDYVMGYFGMDQNGYGASTKLYTWMPSSYSTDYFIVFAYTNGTQVTITNKNTDTIVWSGTLNRGEHYTDSTLSANFVEVESTYPVSALSYNDQGYFVPSANQKWSGTEFYTYADYLGGWPNTLHVMVYEDDTTITIKNTVTDATVWTGTLNAGQEHEITSTVNIYYSIFADKTITVGVLPVDGYSNGYYYGTYMMDKTGSGIGTEFYVPTLSGGMLWTFAFENDTTINIYNAATSALMGTYHLNQSEAVDINQGYGYWHIVSDKRISGYTGWGGLASAGFAPLLFGEAATGGYWADSRTAEIGESVRFKISVHNTGNTSLEYFNVTDTLPLGLTYADSATVNGVPLEPTDIWNEGMSITWSEPFILQPNEWGYIEFNATVDNCGDLVNLADTSAWFMETQVFAEDTALVSVTCEEQCQPAVTLEKTVWHDEYWDDYTEEQIGDTVRFNITIEIPETGCSLTDGYLDDYLPVELAYIPESTDIKFFWEGVLYQNISGEDCDPVITPNGDTNKLTWSSQQGYGELIPPDSIIYIEFEAEVLDCGNGTLINTANATGYYTCCDYVQIEDTAEVWVYCEQQLYSLSGAIFYTGEETGHLNIALFDQNPEDVNVTPIENINLPEYEFPVDYTFNDLSAGTYYVAAHIDMNDNGGPPDSNEPRGFAINKSFIETPDALVITNANVYGADVTLSIPSQEEETCIMFSAYADGSDWITIENYQLSIKHRNYDPIGGEDYCTDYPEYCGAIYIDGVQHTIELPAEQDIYLIDDQPYLTVSIQELNWFDQFKGRALVTWDGDHTILINDDDFGGADIYTLQLCSESHVGTPGLDVEKYTWNPNDNTWTNESTNFSYGDTVIFNITIRNTGDCTLHNAYDSDWLEEGMAYVEDSCSFTVIQGDTVWYFNGPEAQPLDISYHEEDEGYYYTVLTWWSTGSEPFINEPGTIIYIEFSATITSEESCDWYENWFGAGSYYNGTQLWDESSVEVWVNCESLHAPVVDITYPEDDDVINSDELTINGTAYDEDTFVDEVQVQLYYYDNEFTAHYYNDTLGDWSLDPYSFTASGTGAGTPADPLLWNLLIEPVIFPIEYNEFEVYAIVSDHDAIPLTGADSNWFDWYLEQD